MEQMQENPLVKIYSGIGHTEIPLDIELLMNEIAQYLASKGWILRSGGAKGSDTAFENGCDSINSNLKEIYYPKNVPEWIIEESLNFHPAPKAVRKKPFSLQAMGRNAQIILGKDLKLPSQRVIGYCEYDSDGKWIGGTSHGFRISHYYKIPIYNLYLPEVREMFIKKLNRI